MPLSLVYVVAFYSSMDGFVVTTCLHESLF